MPSTTNDTRHYLEDGSSFPCHEHVVNLVRKGYCDVGEPNDTLTRAIEYLGAVEVAPGRYAWQPNGDEWRVWRVVDAETLLDLAAWVGLDPFRCGHAMPTWWSPERRLAWRLVGDPTDTRYETKQDALADLRGIGAIGATIERITADLNTGDEVSA